MSNTKSQSTEPLDDRDIINLIADEPSIEELQASITAWENRHKARGTEMRKVQSRLVKSYNERDTITTNMQKLRAEHETAKMEWAEKDQAHETALANIQTTQKVAEQTAKQLRAEITKLRAIAQYPELVPFAGAINATEDENELQRQIHEMLEGTKTLREGYLTQQRAYQSVGISGVIPPAQPANLTTMSIAELEHHMTEAVGTPEFAKYRNLYIRAKRNSKAKA